MGEIICLTFIWQWIDIQDRKKDKLTALALSWWKFLIHCCCEYWLVQYSEKSIWFFLQKLETGLAYDPTILLLDIYPKNQKKKKTMQKWHLFTIVFSQQPESGKQIKCPWTDKLIEKIYYIYTIEYYAGRKIKFV